ncbi:MAG: hypothetical protein ISQ06_13810 [Planctomycetaceae bacterium]|jgi:hypothetical protein|nr:hypothetical protein [Planctomycetaceae bacterium]
MLKLLRTEFLVALLMCRSLSAQAGDFLEELSAPPASLVESISDAATQPASGIQTVGHTACSAKCGATCNSAGNCGATCDRTGGCCGDGSAGGLLDGALAAPAGILNLDLKSDRAFDGFIEPVTNSVFFEDPRSRTRLRFLFINQTIPNSTPVLGGGDFQVYGLEATFALNERWSIIAQKDGWINLQADGIPHQDGWANLATGLKYVLVRDVENQFLLSTGFQYEWSNGSSEVFQGNGDGVWNPFLSAGKQFNCDTHVITTIGAHLPADNADSSSLFYSLHVDHAFTDQLYGLVELNGLHYVDDGSRLAVPFEGGDLLNLGSTSAEGNYLLTMAFGGTYKFNPNWETAAAYEIPLAAKGDIFDDRLTFTLSFVY